MRCLSKYILKNIKIQYRICGIRKIVRFGGFLCNVMFILIAIFLDHSNLSEQSGQSTSLLYIFEAQQEDVFDADDLKGSHGNAPTAVLSVKLCMFTS